jgi:branched-chain amino acid transport system ATP-binding protein
MRMQGESKALLSVNKINTYYGKTHILSDVSLEVDKQETVALLGRNGFGKSTTLKSIMGLVPPQNGSIRFKGEEIVGLRPHLICRRGIGFVPQERRIFPYLTVRQNLLIGMKPKERAENPWTIERLYHYFPQLEKRDRQKGRYLSGGEQQMLTIARTLMGNPELLLVDEPTEGLAPLVTDLVLHMIRVMQESGCAILLVEHAIDTALRFANRVYIISKGLIVWGGTKEEFYAGGEIKKRYLEV